MRQPSPYLNCDVDQCFADVSNNGPHSTSDEANSHALSITSIMIRPEPSIIPFNGTFGHRSVLELSQSHTSIALALLAAISSYPSWSRSLHTKLSSRYEIVASAHFFFSYIMWVTSLNWFLLIVESL